MSEVVEMATRCTITVRDEEGCEYTIYRHHDGHPECVVSDLWALIQFYNMSPMRNAGYFLANLIFYAKLPMWLESKDGKIDPILKWWEFGYGICPENCKCGSDLDYRYLIYPKDGKVMLKIEQFSYETMNFKEIFDDKIEKAFEKWAESRGCHLKPELLY